jgi:protein-tyrosine-phosphatase
VPILFVCPENSARALMASGLAQKILGPSFEILIAGSEPSETISTLAIDVMNEIGIDISRLRSRSIKDIDLTKINLAIILSSVTPSLDLPSSLEQINWSIPDPEAGRRTYGEKMQRFREAREIIKHRVRILGKELK